MNTTSALFYLFSAVLLGASFLVITARNTVHAALFLVLAFFSAACVWMLLEAEFLAIALVLVYVGAVMVLFLFVVMMLDINTDEVRRDFWKNLPLAGLVGAVIALEMALVLIGGFRVTEVPGTRRRSGAGRQHQAARHRDLHALPLSAADRGRAAAGGHGRRGVAHAAPPQGFPLHRSFRSRCGPARPTGCASCR